MRLGAVPAVALVAGSLPAQGPTTLSGTVLSEGGRPIEFAQVTLDPGAAARQLRTDRDGRWSFVGVPAGSHVLRVTWVGFVPDERAVDVAGGLVTVEVTLRRLTRLDTVTVAARRIGLFGVVIARDSLRPVPGARIEVLGARRADSTDGQGRFALPGVRPGTYLVRVRHREFESRNVPVVVPAGGSAELDIVVDRGMISRDQHMEMLYREMDSRLNARGSNAVMVTREQLRGREQMPMDMALQFVPEFARKSFFMTSDICVFVDGIARPGAQVIDFAPGDIEAIEFYGDPPRRSEPTRSLEDRWPPRTPCGVPPLPSQSRPSRGAVKIRFAVVWLRQR